MAEPAGVRGTPGPGWTGAVGARAAGDAAFGLTSAHLGAEPRAYPGAYPCPTANPDRPGRPDPAVPPPFPAGRSDKGEHDVSRVQPRATRPSPPATPRAASADTAPGPASTRRRPRR